MALCLNSNEMLCVVLCVNNSLNFICISYYFFTIPQYMNNNFKDLRIADIKQTIFKSYKSIEFFQKLKRF